MPFLLNFHRHDCCHVKNNQGAPCVTNLIITHQALPVAASSAIQATGFYCKGYLRSG
jgi:hypothetical protein